MTEARGLYLDENLPADGFPDGDLLHIETAVDLVDDSSFHLGLPCLMVLRWPLLRIIDY